MGGKTGQPQDRHVFGFPDDTEREVEASSHGGALQGAGLTWDGVERVDESLREVPTGGGD